MAHDLILRAHAAMLPDRWAKDVRITIRNGMIAAVEPDAAAGGAGEVVGALLPGLPNLHSHAFQRGMAGLAETGGGAADSFWTWREAMYRFVERIGPAELTAIAAMAQVEMLESGFTRVGEFHYLHHDRDGARFADPAEMSSAIVAAAAETGIALTLLPVFYAHGGFGGAPPNERQRRFVNDMDGFARLLEAARTGASALPDAVVGVAPHSLRAVAPEDLHMLVPLAERGPVHIHIAEQTREVDECLRWSNARPVAWLLDNAVVDERWCLVHATHVVPAEIAAMARTGGVVGLCPITEANLGDGVFPAAAFVAAGGRLGVGSDSNVLIDAAEELRLLEYGQRLTLRQRNVLGGPGGRSTGDGLYRRALAGGGQALGAGGGIAVGAPADLVGLDIAHPALVGRSGAQLADAFLFAAGRSAIDRIWRRGRVLVAGGRHHARDRVVARYRAAIGTILA